MEGKIIKRRLWGYLASQVAHWVKNMAAMREMQADAGSILGSGGHGNPLQYSCLENPMDRGAWQAMGHRVTESDPTEATKHAHRGVSLENPRKGPVI